MGYRPEFDISLAKGGLREDAFANVLFKATVEVKSNPKGKETGNFFLEFRQRGKPSGIALTKAEFWAIEFDDDCWIILPTERLKRVGRRIFREFPQLVRMGGDNQNEGVLIPLAELRRAA